MRHRFLTTIIGISALILANFPVTEVAMAIDIRCIEASKYKYLLQMFDSDREKFAKFFRLSHNWILEIRKFPEGISGRTLG